MSKAARKLLKDDNDHQYGVIGHDTCMGDHKVMYLFDYLMTEYLQIFLFLQPVFLKIQIKTNQGIVSSCDHAEIDSDKENIVMNSGLKHSNNCVMCLKHLNAITEKFSDSIPVSASLPLQSQRLTFDSQKLISPLVSISVVDTDNLSICMCNSMDDQINHELIDGDNICKICRNNIKQQPTERLTLVSKRVMLGDIVVNRIDTQYLSSTYPSMPSQLRKLQDPYTPESVESHSPQAELELDEKEFPIINETLDSDDILCNIRELNKHKHVFEPDELCGERKESPDEEKIGNLQNQYNLTHTVSPKQLTTRLEILRRESQLMLGSDGGSKSGSGSGADIDDKKSLNKSKCCFRCSCVIS